MAGSSTHGNETILVSVTGQDAPGLTTDLLSILGEAGAEVGDIEQVVIRGRLNLGILIRVPTGRDLLRELLLFGWEHGMQVHFEPVDPTPTPIRVKHAVTVLARELSPACLASATAAIAKAGGNIDRIWRLSRTPVMSYEFLVVDADEDVLREAMVKIASEHHFDVAVQREMVGRRNKRLVVLDVDQTLIQDEIIDLLADEAGVGAQVHEITTRAMAGELDFETSLRERVALLAGLDEAALIRARDRVRLTPGAATFIRTLHRLGLRTAIISGGFQYFTDHLAERLGLDHAYGNVLEVVDGVLTGGLVGPIIDAERKAVLMRELAASYEIPLAQTVAVGDGANDLNMLQAAGLGIAFNAKALVRDAADTAVSVPYLDAVLFLLGYRSEDILAADEHFGSDADATRRHQDRV
jgi:phosphoserine phosphatase